MSRGQSRNSIFPPTRRPDFPYQSESDARAGVLIWQVFQFAVAFLRLMPENPEPPSRTATSPAQSHEYICIILTPGPPRAELSPYLRRVLIFARRFLVTLSQNAGHRDLSSREARARPPWTKGIDARKLRSSPATSTCNLSTWGELVRNAPRMYMCFKLKRPET